MREAGGEACAPAGLRSWALGNTGSWVLLRGDSVRPELEGHLEERAGPLGTVTPTMLCVLKDFTFIPELARFFKAKLAAVMYFSNFAQNGVSWSSKRALRLL